MLATKKIELFNLLALLSLLTFVFRGNFFLLKYIFFVSTITITFLLKGNLIHVKDNFRGKLYDLVPFGIIAVIYIMSAFVFDFNIVVFKELTNTIVILFFLLLMDVSFLKKWLSFDFFQFTSVLVTLSIFKILIETFLGNQYLFGLFTTSSSSNLNGDYNFFALTILLGIISLLFNINRIKLSYFIIILFMHELVILFSNSRRAVFVLGITLIIFIIYGLMYKKKVIIKGVIASIAFFILPIILILTSNEYLPSNFKGKIIEKYNRYSLLNKNEDDILKLKEGIWNRESNYNKDSFIENRNFSDGLKYWETWASNSKLELLKEESVNSVLIDRVNGNRDQFSLAYVGPRIIYYGGLVYKFDFEYKIISSPQKKCFNFGLWVNDRGYGYNRAINLNTHEETLVDGWIKAKAYYYFMDNQYDIPGFINSVADSTKLQIRSINVGILNSSGYINRINNLSKDISISEYIEEVNPSSSINLIANGDFSHNNIFWEKTNDKVVIESNKITGIASGRVHLKLKSTNPSFKLNENNKYKLEISLKNTASLISFGYKMNKEATKIDNASFIKYEKGLIFIDTIICSNKIVSPIIDVVFLDSLRTPNIKLFEIGDDKKNTELKENVFFNNRLDKWNLAFEIYFKEYSLKEKLIGKGGYYLKRYSMKSNEEPRFDYPHNPIISSFLFSGIFGGFTYIWFLIIVFIKYYKKRKELKILSLMYLITFLFMMFSGNSHFSVPIFTLLSLVPLLIKSNFRIENK